jgi:hypothetical protein
MSKIIRLCYRKIIDANATKMWEKMLFDDTYVEFKMQSQRFNQQGKFTAFSDMLTNATEAEQLHFLVSGAAVGYIKQLNQKIPDILNTLGKHFLPFKNFRFEIINADIKDKAKYRVAVNFFSEPVTWVDTVGENLIVSTNNTIENNELLTDTFTLQPFLSIYSIQQKG